MSASKWCFLTIMTCSLIIASLLYTLGYQETEAFNLSLEASRCTLSNYTIVETTCSTRCRCYYVTINDIQVEECQRCDYVCFQGYWNVTIEEGHIATIEGPNKDFSTDVQLILEKYNIGTGYKCYHEKGEWATAYWEHAYAEGSWIASIFFFTLGATCFVACVWRWVLDCMEDPKDCCCMSNMV
jgi:hypothetical protein